MRYKSRNKIYRDYDMIINCIEIGEVKYTNNKVYMYKGLEELLKCIYFVKDKNY